MQHRTPKYCYHLPKFTNGFTKIAAPVKNGKIWRHRLMVKGIRVSGTFETKAAALAWEAGQRVPLADGNPQLNILDLRLVDRFDLMASLNLGLCPSVLPLQAKQRIATTDSHVAPELPLTRIVTR